MNANESLAVPLLRGVSRRRARAQCRETPRPGAGDRRKPPGHGARDHRTPDGRRAAHRGLVEFKYFTNAAAEKGKILGRDTPDAETVEQALAYRKALTRRPDWSHEIAAPVVEVCGNAGCNWFDL